MSKTFGYKMAGIFAVFVFTALVSVGQTTAERYLISAKAGGINYVEGGAQVTTANGQTMAAIKGGSVRDGETIRTSEIGKAEVLLNPGSFVRMTSNTDVRFDSTNLNDVRLAINAGSAILEVYATDRFTVNVATPKGHVILTETGVYRFDVRADGSAMVSVIKGKVMIGNLAIRSGRGIEIGVSNATAIKVDTKRSDGLNDWSRSRSEAVAKATNSLKNSTLRDSLAYSVTRNEWDFFSSFGLWVYNYNYGGFCFLPFGVNWNSPYGFWYRRGFFQYAWGDHVWIRATTPPVSPCNPNSNCSGTNNGQTNTGFSAAGTTRSSGSNSANPAVPVRPPFEAINPTTRSSGVFSNDRGSDRGFEVSQPVRVSTPNIYAPPAASPPASVPMTRPRRE